MTTTQITCLAIQGICLLICLGALIYQLNNYSKMKKQLKEEERKRIEEDATQWEFQPTLLPYKEFLIKKLCEQGCTQREIAKFVHLSQSTVFRIMRKHGWKKNIIKGKE